MCNTATLMNNAPANVDPMILNLELDLKFLDLIGNVPMKHTNMKKTIMNRIFNNVVMVVYYMFYMILFYCRVNFDKIILVF